MAKRDWVSPTGITPCQCSLQSTCQGVGKVPIFPGTNASRKVSSASESQLNYPTRKQHAEHSKVIICHKTVTKLRNKFRMNHSSNEHRKLQKFTK